jgi:hypothetical protein
MVTQPVIIYYISYSNVGGESGRYYHKEFYEGTLEAVIARVSKEVTKHFPDLQENQRVSLVHRIYLSYCQIFTVKRHTLDMKTNEVKGFVSIGPAKDRPLVP